MIIEGQGKLNYRGYYSEEIKRKLWEYGLDGECGNFESKRELNIKEIEKIAQIISKHDGIYTYYKQWYSKPIQSWRLCYSFEK